MIDVRGEYKYKYNSYFYCAPYSLTDGALQKSANTCFTAVGRLKYKNVLRERLKLSVEQVDVFSLVGSQFQALVAATEKALSLSLRCVRGTM